MILFGWPATSPSSTVRSRVEREAILSLSRAFSASCAASLSCELIADLMARAAPRPRRALDKVRRAAFQCLYGKGHLTMPRYDDHRPADIPAPEMLQEFDAIDFAHSEIPYETAGLKRRKDIEKQPRRCKYASLVLRAAEQERERMERRFVVHQ